METQALMTGSGLRIIRKEMGLSQRDLAFRIESSQGYISWLERTDSVVPASKASAVETLADSLKPKSKVILRKASHSSQPRQALNVETLLQVIKNQNTLIEQLIK